MIDHSHRIGVYKQVLMNKRPISTRHYATNEPRKTRNAMVTKSFRIKPKTSKLLSAIAKRREVSISSYVARAIERELELDLALLTD